MRKVEAAAEQTAHVPPEVVWSLLSDVMVYPQWGPWRKSGYRSEGDAAANGKGAVYWLEGSKRYGFRYPVSVEEILDVEPGKRLAYTVLRGIPVRNYRAEVTLTPSPDGTLIRWGASWDRTIMVRAAGKPPHAVLQVIEANGVMARVAAGGLQSHLGGNNVPDRQQAQVIKADQRHLLSELNDGGAADGEDRDPVYTVNAVVTGRIRAQDVRVEARPRSAQQTSR